MSAHTCHAIGCPTPVAPRRFLCGSHWRMLPKPLRDEIWGTYRRGQETTKTPSVAYLEAAHAARHWLHVQEGLPGRLCMVCNEAGREVAHAAGLVD